MECWFECTFPQKICDCTNILNSEAPFSNNHINTYLDKNTLRKIDKINWLNTNTEEIVIL